MLTNKAKRTSNSASRASHWPIVPTDSHDPAQCNWVSLRVNGQSPTHEQLGYLHVASARWSPLSSATTALDATVCRRVSTRRRTCESSSAASVAGYAWRARITSAAGYSEDHRSGTAVPHCSSSRSTTPTATTAWRLAPPSSWDLLLKSATVGLAQCNIARHLDGRWRRQQLRAA